MVDDQLQHIGLDGRASNSLKMSLKHKDNSNKTPVT